MLFTEGSEADAVIHWSLDVHRTLYCYVCHSFDSWEGDPLLWPGGSLVSVITDYRNLGSWSFPIQQYSGGLSLMQTANFQSINQHGGIDRLLCARKIHEEWWLWRMA